MNNTIPKKSTSKCQAKHPSTKEPICNRYIWDDNEKRCIFHCKEKPVEEFKECFIAELNHVNKTDTINEFDGRCFIFPKNINLTEISFNKPVDFAFAEFGDNASFRGAEFGNDADLWGTKFGNDASFEKAQFGNDASFEKAQFGNDASFLGAKFGDKAYFWGTQFGSKVNFREAQFGNAFFVETQFGNDASFEKAQFGNDAFFGKAQFGDKAFFNGAKLEDKVNFWGTKFGNDASFEKAQFGNDASFEKAQFGDKANFWKVQFGDKANFESTKFGNQLSFMDARFKGEIILKDIKFKETNVDKVNNFTNITFERPNQVRIDNVDLNSIALVKTNVQNIDFLNCSWSKIGKRFVVFDEIYHFKNNANKTKYLKETTLDELEQLYLRLQSNCENNKRYDDAGKFYISAMEMRRKQIAENSKSKIWRWLRQNLFSLTAWYRIISYYGERWNRTLVWMMLAIFLFPTVYMFTGFDYQESTVNYDINIDGTMNLQMMKDYLKAFVISFHILTYQRGDFFTLTIESRVISVIELAISATFLSLLLLAIRRHFHR
jgi:hypothetical protein